MTSSPDTKIESAIVHILGDNGVMFGAGLLVSEQHIVTFTRVVLDALGYYDSFAGPLPKDIRLNLDFHFVSREKSVHAEVISSTSYRDPKLDNRAYEIVLLTIADDPPEGAFPARLAMEERPADKSCQFYGFNEGLERGDWIKASVRGHPMDGVLDILPTDAGTFLSEHGIRGAPVVLQELDLVIGIIAATERQKEGTTVYAISASVLRSAFPDVLSPNSEKPDHEPGSKQPEVAWLDRLLIQAEVDAELSEDAKVLLELAGGMVGQKKRSGRSLSVSYLFFALVEWGRQGSKDLPPAPLVAERLEQALAARNETGYLKILGKFIGKEPQLIRGVAGRICTSTFRQPFQGVAQGSFFVGPASGVRW